ncbi:hypothetical protein CKO15_07165 [Halorhodospira abdelmalekii]|uniref:hypothetical protein n=1 Tax=Halorhodospira abdelmalekii TaxID=421629 RepID=UPI001904745E|nr:hypothetical protein [Halorhodospira abdelmalekii]MBK1735067.1 hypothetical protein [Halorhodospira abdelmalekii]
MSKQLTKSAETLQRASNPHGLRRNTTEPRSGLRRGLALLGGGLLVTLLSGCATPNATPISLDGGKEQGQVVECSGWTWRGRLAMSDCIIKANEVCPGGYDVKATTLTDRWHKPTGAAEVLEDMNRAMLIRCAETDAEVGEETEEELEEV